jgi:hypothetical protein
MKLEDVGPAVQRLCKWRTVFASLQLGTREEGDPELKAIKDHREVTILLRAEVSTLTGLLIRKGVFTEEEFTVALGEEAEKLSAAYERRFPGMEATDQGIAYDIARIQREGTMQEFPP